jgi:CDP-diacylglycerol--glycerol-3-phosphate 3-phosphatidyltransferase
MENPHRPSPLRRLADLLTVGRALLGLPLILALAGGQEPLAWLLLLLGGLSDWADGWLARRAGGGSVWGARLDPLTDKILVSAPLLWLAAAGWRAGQDSGGPASAGGKAKTVLQFASLLLLLWPACWGTAAMVDGLRQSGWWLFWPSLLLALGSAWGYLRRG